MSKRIFVKPCLKCGILIHSKSGEKFSAFTRRNLCPTCLYRQKIEHLNKVRKGKAWTKQDLEFLRQNYPDSGSKFCAQNLGRSRFSVKLKAQKLKIRVTEATKRQLSGIQKIHEKNAYKCDEDAIIFMKYSQFGAKEVAKLLPRHTVHSIRQRACYLGVKVDADVAKKLRVYHPFSKHEDDKIRKLYPTLGPSMHQTMPGRSYGVIKYRARKLGVRREIFSY